MSSRQEEKEQRRREREALEEADRKAQARKKRLGVVGGAALATALLAAVVIAIASSGGDDSEGGGGGGETPAAAIPERQERNLAAAAKAAGCTVKRHRDYGSEHVSEPVKYETNPPTSGSHDPVAAEDGIYEAGNPPDLEQSVHALEHGRINVQYRAGTPAQQIGQLQTLRDESLKGREGYHTLLFENQSGMKPAVAATAWTQSLTCDAINDKTWDALRAFREDFVDKGPEFIP
jgi:hypothetical protein